MHKGNSNCSVLLTASFVVIVQSGLLVGSASVEATNRSQTEPVVAAYPVLPCSALAATSTLRQSRISIPLKHSSLGALIAELLQPIPASFDARWIHIDVANRADPNEARLTFGRSPPSCLNALQ
jgi:hypothetical protein